MTTSVTIDAHAGWPVLVTMEYGEPLQPKSVTSELVEPGTKRVFYIHSGLKIIGVSEQPRPTPVPLAEPDDNGEEVDPALRA